VGDSAIGIDSAPLFSTTPKLAARRQLRCPTKPLRAADGPLETCSNQSIFGRLGYAIVCNITPNQSMTDLDESGVNSEILDYVQFREPA
jgi:hypothetical protein